jgi:glycosyltransferase involved in cell wall biosynthesis
MNIIYKGPFRDAGGYAKMNREIVKSLCSNNINVKIDEITSASKKKELDIDYLFKLTDKINESENNDKFSITGALPQFPNSGKFKKNILFTMMETETIDKKFIEKCNMFQEVWVPCEWNFKSFKEFGLKRSIKKITLGVDIDLYKPKEREEREDFIFLSVFGWSLRKGYDILLRAFIRKFKDEDNVKLIIFSRLWGSESFHKKEVITNTIKKICLSEKIEFNPEKIVFIGNGIEEKEMPNLYNHADCFVLPTRGDAWCLPAIEAGACEIPVISTNYGGQTEFLNEENSFLIKTEGFENCSCLGLENISSYYSKDTKIVKLGEESIKDLMEKMDFVYKNYNIAKSKSYILRKQIEEKFTWDHSAKKIISALQE